MTLTFELTKEDFVDYNVFIVKRNKLKSITTNVTIAFLILFPSLFDFYHWSTLLYFYIAAVLIYSILHGTSRNGIRKRTEKYLISGRNAGLLGIRTVIFKEEHFILNNEFVYAELKWNSFEKIQESKDSIFLFQLVNQAIIIPKRIFLLPQEEYDVKSFIERKLAEQKKQS